MNADPGPHFAFPLLFLVLIFFGIASFGLWLWSLIHCVTNRRLSDTNRIIGIVLIVTLSLLGSLVYLFLPRDQDPQDPRQRLPG